MDYISTESPWAPPADILELTSEEEFTNVQSTLKYAIQKTSQLHPYNNLDTFVNFHQTYRAQKELTLEQFTMVSPVIHEDSRLSCIGLSYKIIKYVTETSPDLGRYLFFAICNDFDLDTPVPTEPPLDKLASLFDHMLVVLAFSLNGRKGYIFSDNALLVDFPIVIMTDCRWPHTGLFRSESRDGHRENNVQMANDSYVVWNQTDRKDNGKTMIRRRLAYLGRPFLLGDNVERRTQVMPFHGYILMGAGGFKAGFYIILGKENQRFTLSVPRETGELVSLYLPYDYFCTENVCDEHIQNVYNDETRAALTTFSDMCGFGGIEALMKRFRRLSETCMDTDFMEEAVMLHKQYCAALKKAILDSVNSEFGLRKMEVKE